MQKLIIIGAGGHGKEVAWSVAEINAREPRFELLGFCDDGLAPGTVVLGLPVLGPVEAVAAVRGSEIGYICAVGKNKVRPRLVERAAAAGWRPVSVVNPSAVVSPDAEIGPGTFLAPGTYVGPHASVGAHCIVNFHASIGHDAVMGEHVQVCPGARVSGNVRLGTGVFLGSNAAVSPGVTMGDWSKLSACSFAAVPVPPGVTALGIPARILPPFKA